jgi:hypothetical protein
MELASSAPHRPRNLLEALNSEAGDHPVCRDPRELQAALRAGQRSWRRFPYYEARYADRGQQFTRSDSAWLVALAEHGAVVVDDQVAWLGRVLGSRGMPQWLLELHLEVLHAELIAALPGRAAVYASLLGAATMLRAQREEHFDDAALAEFAAAFTQQVDEPWDARLPETGALLAAAVADEAAGLKRAVPSIAGWMTDPQRFPGRWIAAVEQTIARARDRVG